LCLFNILTNRNGDVVKAAMIPDKLTQHFTLQQLALQQLCLSLLWTFGETHQDRKFVLSKDAFPLAVDALLLQPHRLEDTGHIDLARIIVCLNESANGCCGG